MRFSNCILSIILLPGVSATFALPMPSAFAGDPSKLPPPDAATAIVEYPTIANWHGIEQDLELLSNQTRSLSEADLVESDRRYAVCATAPANDKLRERARLATIEYSLGLDVQARYLLLLELSKQIPNKEFPAFVGEIEAVVLDLVSDENVREGYLHGPESPHKDVKPNVAVSLTQVLADAVRGRQNIPPGCTLVDIQIGLVNALNELPRQSSATSALRGSGNHVDSRKSFLEPLFPDQVLLLDAELHSIAERQDRRAEQKDLVNALKNLQRDTEAEFAKMEAKIAKIAGDIDQLRQDQAAVRSDLAKIAELPRELSLLTKMPLPEELADTGMTPEQETGLLKRYAPVLVWDEARDGDGDLLIEALVSPSYFVNSADSLWIGGPDPKLDGAYNPCKQEDRDFAKAQDRASYLAGLSSKNCHRWQEDGTANNLWLHSSKATRGGPTGDKTRSTLKAIQDHCPIIGCVQPLGKSFWSLQFYVLLAFNNAVNTEGHHQGDEICVEVIIGRFETATSPIYALFMHNHGKIILAEPRALTFQDPIQRHHPKAFLTAGDNEPFPVPGGVGDAGEVVPGVYRSDDLGWLGIGDTVSIRPHNGTGEKDGYVYELKNGVVSVTDPNSIDAKLVRYYPGHWGATHTSGFFVDGESPKSPMFNRKMRRREFGDWTPSRVQVVQTRSHSGL